eukprot:scaffold426_cov219-Amphora_coffeaeformis.AAC.47
MDYTTMKPYQQQQKGKEEDVACVKIDVLLPVPGTKYEYVHRPGQSVHDRISCIGERRQRTMVLFEFFSLLDHVTSEMSMWIDMIPKIVTLNGPEKNVPEKEGYVAPAA